MQAIELKWPKSFVQERMKFARRGAKLVSAALFKGNRRTGILFLLV